MACMSRSDSSSERHNFIPLPWPTRDGNVPDIPGGVGDRLHNLRRLLEIVDGGVNTTETIAWPAGTDTLVSQAVRRATRCGLLVREGTKVYLTSEGKEWLTTGEVTVLAGVFHRHIRFFGEILHLLANSKRSNEELRKIACDRYSMAWAEVHPVRNRTEWLRELGLVNLLRNKGNLILTDLGREVTQVLEPGFPPELDAEAKVKPPSKAIAEVLHRTTVQDLAQRDRKTQILIPPGPPGTTKEEVVQSVVVACSFGISSADFSEALHRAISKDSYKSVKAVRAWLEKVGLIDQTGQDTWTTTLLAETWLASENPIDLAGILQTRLWYFAEMLKDLSEIGASKVEELKAQSTKFAGEGLNDNQIRDRLQILRACGLVSKLNYSTYQITPEGRAFLKLVPRLEAANTTKNIAHQGDLAVQSQPAFGADETQSSEQIASELESAARDTNETTRLELAAVNAFRFLGFKAEHLGGSGRPDGMIHCDLGIWGEVVALEVKTAENGIVSHNLSNYLKWKDHRREYGVEKTITVGPGFDQTLTNQFAEDESVAAVLVETLAEAVRRQPTTPLTPAELEVLFDTDRDATSRHQVLREEHERAELLANTVAGILRVLNDEVTEPKDMQRSMDRVAIMRSLRQIKAPHGEDIVATALEFLTHPFVGIVQRTHGEKTEPEWYRLAAEPRIAQMRMVALSRTCGGIELE